MTKAATPRAAKRSAKKAMTRATKKSRAKTVSAKDAPKSEVKDPALLALDQEIVALSAMIQGEIEKRAEAAGYRADVFFRVVLNPINTSSGV